MKPGYQAQSRIESSTKIFYPFPLMFPPARLLVLLFLLLVFSAGGAFADEPAEVVALRAKAERGNALAQYNLGLAYAQGQLVPADLPEAFVWLSLASENGSTGKALDTIVGNISDAQLTEGRRRLREYRAILAAKNTVTLGNSPAPHKLSPRGFSLTAPPAEPKSTNLDPAASPVTRPPEAADTDDLVQLRKENARLKSALAETTARLNEQAAAIARLQAELALKFPAVAETLPAESARKTPTAEPISRPQ
jgi:TPR repeat protein